MKNENQNEANNSDINESAIGNAPLRRVENVPYGARLNELISVETADGELSIFSRNGHKLADNTFHFTEPVMASLYEFFREIGITHNGNEHLFDNGVRKLFNALLENRNVTRRQFTDFVKTAGEIAGQPFWDETFEPMSILRTYRAINQHLNKLQHKTNQATEFSEKMFQMVKDDPRNYAIYNSLGLHGFCEYIANQYLKQGAQNDAKSKDWRSYLQTNYSETSETVGFQPQREIISHGTLQTPQTPGERPMGKYRGDVCEIVGGMLDNPDAYGIFPTGRCYEKLDELIERAQRDAFLDFTRKLHDDLRPYFTAQDVAEISNAGIVDFLEMFFVRIKEAEKSPRKDDSIHTKILHPKNLADSNLNGHISLSQVVGLFASWAIRQSKGEYPKNLDLAVYAFRKHLTQEIGNRDFERDGTELFTLISYPELHDLLLKMTSHEDFSYYRDGWDLSWDALMQNTAFDSVKQAIEFSL